jgi:predicted nucleotidyltransferase
MLMESIIEENIDEIKSLCVYYKVKELFAFGSVVTGKFNNKSDVDLLISFMPMEAGDYADNYFQLAEEFENIFNRSVDLVTDKSLKNPYFIDAVNKSKTLIYG